MPSSREINTSTLTYLYIATMSFAGAGCGLQTRRRVDLAAVRFGLCGVVVSEPDDIDIAIISEHCARIRLTITRIDIP